MTESTKQPLDQTPSDSDAWKQRTYATGIFVGGVVGFLSAYLFARSAEENDDGKPDQISTGTLISLLLGLLGLIRQVADSGKKKKK